MSYNGSGTFNINTAGQPVVTGTVISSTAFNALTADLGTGLSTAITKDGQTVATARIPFAQGINSSLVTDATSTTTGSIITAGGVGIAKALYVGTTLNVTGASTLAGITGTFNGTVGATTPSTGAFTTLSATGITTVAAGSAALPAIVSTTGTADTGLWFPAADTIAASTAGTERLRIDSSGNLLVGTTTPVFNAAGRGLITINGSSAAALGFTVGAVDKGILIHTGTDIIMSNSVAGAITFQTTNTERMRLDASGNLGLGVTPSGSSAGALTQLQIGGSGGLSTFYGQNNDYACGVISAAYFNSSSQYVYAATSKAVSEVYLYNGDIMFRNAAAGTAGNTFTPTERMRISSAGIVTMSAYGAGAATFSAAGVISSVSDETWKIKDGAPVDTDAMLNKLEPGYWYYNDEKKDTFGADRQLGFYAQNVNAAIGPEAAPEPETVVTKNDDGTETSVTKPWGYYDRSVLAVTVMSLQKALATIESLTARITALEAK